MDLRHFFRLVLCVIAMGALTSTAARAAVTCVTTGAELQTALSDAQSNDVDDEIRIAIGVLHYGAEGVPFQRWQYNTSKSNYLFISGGWNAANGCANRVTNNPRLTRIDGDFLGAAFRISVSGSAAPIIDLSNFQIGGTLQFAVQIITSPTATPDIRLERVLIDQSTSGGCGNTCSPLDGRIDGGTITVRDVWIINSDGGASGAMRFQVGTDGHVYLVNNTVTGNTGTSSTAAGGLRLSGTGFISASNNVFVDNLAAGAAQDVRFDNAIGILRSNHIGVATGTAGSIQGTTTGPALFDDPMIDSPSAGSPLRNSGQNAPAGGLPTLDFFGNLRVQGIAVDRGAFEFAELFGNGFE